MPPKRKKSPSPKGAGGRGSGTKKSRHRSRSPVRSSPKGAGAGTSSAEAQGAEAQGAEVEESTRKSSSPTGVYKIINNQLNIHAPHIMDIIAKQSFSPRNSQGWPDDLYDRIAENYIIRYNEPNSFFNYRMIEFMSYFEDKHGEAILHSLRDQPAIVYIDGIREWYKNGQLHRGHDKPAIINEYGGYDNIELSWYKNGQLHRINGPAYIKDYNNVHIEKWYKNGKLHRVDGPSLIEIKNGVITEEVWTKDDEPYRIDKPAIIIRDRYGNTMIEKWFRNGRLHRDNGPARSEIKIGSFLPVLIEEWYNNGVLIDSKQTVLD